MYRMTVQEVNESIQPERVVDVDVEVDADIDRRIVCNNQVSVSWLRSP